MTTGKRLFDIVFGLLIFLPGLPIILVVGMLILIRDGRPVFYLSRRMKTPTQSFNLIKFRTLRADANDHDDYVLGADKAHRITPLGHFLRQIRLDEIPQLWNVLRGDISFVGPRPPTPHYVALFPDLYAQVLKSRPGITGLATVMFHRHEELMLAQCKTAKETEATYVRRCIPRKARLDLLYQNKRSAALDAYLMYLTATKFFPLPGRRIKRLQRD
ncbi:MAG: lipopolysaccharide/colanic/teichoic acid biosynthesis glycosyltransferase [Paracoccaceae bacterium]|jgi:lipopolysaccharide/colanic/teichoic acid biosynthesis glycosyltransferase